MTKTKTLDETSKETNSFIEGLTIIEPCLFIPEKYAATDEARISHLEQRINSFNCKKEALIEKTIIGSAALYALLMIDYSQGFYLIKEFINSF